MSKKLQDCWQAGWSACMAEQYMMKTLGPIMDKKRVDATAFAGLAARFSGHLRDAAPRAAKSAKKFERAAHEIQRALQSKKPSDKAWDKASGAYDIMEREITQMQEASRQRCGIDLSKEIQKRAKKLKRSQ